MSINETFTSDILHTKPHKTGSISNSYKSNSHSAAS